MSLEKPEVVAERVASPKDPGSASAVENLETVQKTSDEAEESDSVPENSLSCPADEEDAEVAAAGENEESTEKIQTEEKTESVPDLSIVSHSVEPVDEESGKPEPEVDQEIRSEAGNVSENLISNNHVDAASDAKEDRVLAEESVTGIITDGDCDAKSDAVLPSSEIQVDVAFEAESVADQERLGDAKVFAQDGVSQIAEEVNFAAQVDDHCDAKSDAISSNVSTFSDAQDDAVSYAKNEVANFNGPNCNGKSSFVASFDSDAGFGEMQVDCDDNRSDAQTSSEAADAGGFTSPSEIENCVAEKKLNLDAIEKEPLADPDKLKNSGGVELPTTNGIATEV